MPFNQNLPSINPWNKIFAPNIPLSGYLPFVIAAGGLTAKDVKPWLDEGYDALAIGRELMKEGELDPALLSWLVTHK